MSLYTGNLKKGSVPKVSESTNFNVSKYCKNFK